MFVLFALVVSCRPENPDDPTPRVILIQGSCSSSDLFGDSNHWMPTVKSILTTRYGFTDAPPGDPADQVIEFGYSESGWDQEYAPTDTLKSIGESSAGLEDIYAHYPDSEFFVIGHSLGGIVALDGFARYADAENGMVERTGGIITVSSGVKGLDPENSDTASLLVELVACRQLPQAERSPVWSDLETTGDSITLIHNADWSETRVVNFGNKRDQVVNWQRAILQPPFEVACYDNAGIHLLDLNHDTLLKERRFARELLEVLIDGKESDQSCE